MPELVVYGIENCDQVRKARAWLRAHGVEHRLHDFRRDGLAPERLAAWLGRVPWDSLLNRRGLGWRKLDPARRAQVTDAASAAELLLEDPVLIKRPVLEHESGIVVGFSEAIYESLFGAGPDASP
ncbi:ArsC family reductase [Burkholderiaceae bacterium FT117]|uniref:ArsC family reductase n=1 Tax=Zeimonas sediminis TaxID=2944268 RepID=UPI002342D7DA|nr:ArsC family reductase [Zeimonas sediminis]MCM5569173.1 ArsC family reductase [Zeimonas sediminis]